MQEGACSARTISRANIHSRSPTRVHKVTFRKTLRMTSLLKICQWLPGAMSAKADYIGRDLQLTQREAALGRQSSIITIVTTWSPQAPWSPILKCTFLKSISSIQAILKMKRVLLLPPWIPSPGRPWNPVRCPGSLRLPSKKDLMKS